MAYSIERIDNNFKITTNSLLYATVYTQTFCNSNQWEILIPEQSSITEINITLPKKDDLYKIIITDKLLITEEVLISIYTSFLKSFVEDVEHILCGCPCADYDDYNKTEKDYLSAILKLLSYSIINGAIYNKYLTATNGCVKCSILDANQCVLTHEMVIGNADNTLLMKQLIAYYYLVYYYTDLVLNNNSITVTGIYNYNNIIKCIKKLGINEDCIKDAVYSVDGIYDVQFNNTFM
jgi:hypothetical protein